MRKLADPFVAAAPTGGSTPTSMQVTAVEHEVLVDAAAAPTVPARGYHHITGGAPFSQRRLVQATRSSANRDAGR